jgi:hypothetical protein
MRKIATSTVLVLALAGVGALGAQDGELDMLASLQRGQWTVTSQDGGPTRSLCLGNPAQLLQLRHAGRACNRYVVEEEADKVTVQYNCRGSGYGRTTIRRETAALVQIESQGVARGAPFQFRAEARRTGACR